MPAAMPVTRPATIIARTGLFAGRWLFVVLVAFLLCGEHGAAAGQRLHGLAMHGAPALPAGFDHLPYANPQAPKGGEIRYGVVGTFDNLNPFILKGMRTTARGVIDPEYGNLVFESLMFRSRDEAFTVYGLLAESIEIDDARSFITFHINPDARWSDGQPVSAQDVAFTFELLRDKGRPPFNRRLVDVERMEILSERSIRFVFKPSASRELPLIIGLTPILPAHASHVETFEQTTLEPMIGSGPYRIVRVEPGERVVFERNRDYWARDLPVKRGLDNYDRITVDYFLSQSAQFEAFKKGVFDIYPEGNPTRWARSFDFPAVTNGEVIKDTFTSDTPAPIYGFVFNTRRAVFSDRRVRHALSMLFDFEWVNRNLFNGAYQRTESFWQNSELSAIARPTSAGERELLSAFAQAVSPDVLEGRYRVPVTDGSGRDRQILRQALSLLEEAGYSLNDGQLVNSQGLPFSFEVMTERGTGEIGACLSAHSFRAWHHHVDPHRR